jgi:CheY-like chemotaxis protein
LSSLMDHRSPRQVVALSRRDSAHEIDETFLLPWLSFYFFPSPFAVIFVTAKSSAEDRVETILLGAEDVLAKPFSSKELIARSHLQVGRILLPHSSRERPGCTEPHPLSWFFCFQMQMGKRRIELERNYNARTQDIQLRAVEAEVRPRLSILSEILLMPLTLLCLLLYINRNDELRLKSSDVSKSF